MVHRWLLRPLRVWRVGGRGVPVSLQVCVGLHWWLLELVLMMLVVCWWLLGSLCCLLLLVLDVVLGAGRWRCGEMLIELVRHRCALLDARNIVGLRWVLQVKCRSLGVLLWVYWVL